MINSLRSQKINAVRSKIKSLDENVAQLKDQVSAIQEKIKELENERANLESQLSPVWMLPPEILSYIFELAHLEDVAGKNMKFFWNKKLNYTFAINVSHVSQHFRVVAIKTLSLWATIHLRGIGVKQLDYIKTCLRRSGKIFPLDVYLRVICPSRYPVTMQAMTLIHANACQLKRFELVLESDEPMHVRDLYRLPPNPTVLLLSTKDNLPIDADVNTPGPSPFVHFEEGMHRLTKSRLEDALITWLQCISKNLIKLDLQAVSVFRQEDLWAIIGNSSSLRKLDLSALSFLPSQPDSGLPVIQGSYVLESLEELELSEMSTDDTFALVSRLRAPRLQSLNLSSLADGDFSAVLNHISASAALFPNLSSLSLKHVRTSDMKAVAEGLRQAYTRLQYWRGYSPDLEIICLEAALGHSVTSD